VSKRKLLAVMAHPDDESFGPGGALAKAVADGVEVHLVTATDGAAGTAEGLAGEALAEERRRELKRAATALGVTLHLLDYRDSGFHDPEAAAHPDAFVTADLDEVIRAIQSKIQEVKPDVLLTHDETGGYGHPDHVLCHDATVAAFHQAEPWEPQRLYCEASSDRWMKIAARVMRLIGRDPTAVGENKDIDLTKVGVDPRSITTKIDIREHWEAKRAAQSSHQTQGGGPPHHRYLPIWALRRVFPSETFIRTAPPADSRLRETSFFEGLA